VKYDNTMTGSGFWKNYGMTVAMLSGIVIGGVFGVLAGPAALTVKPVGEAFLNMIFVLVVPLVFCCVTTAVYNLKANGVIGSTLLATIASFAILSIIASLMAWGGVVVFNPLKGVDCTAMFSLSDAAATESRGSLFSALVGSLTVPDFHLLLSKSHLLPLMILAALCGWAASAAGEKGKPFAQVVASAQEVVMKMMKAVMYLAPVGLGCWFAATISTTGEQLLGGYLRVFMLYLVLSATYFVLLSSATAAVSGKLRSFWTFIWQPALTAIATSSSAASMPEAIVATKRMGVKDEIADSVIPIGTNIHKGGSIMTGILKVTFVMLLCSQDISSVGALLQILIIGILSSIVLGAVPGGGFTAEVFICSAMGLDPAMVGVMVVINTITDTPATLVNVNSNINASLLTEALLKRLKQ